ncbi:Protein of unknown function [Zobellia uliginosa]|uniref:DUF3500 domain-containing protein n=1 Tax=Zobellia uliginosa TaxID=143224 RepID=A0ABY1KZX0_9FLAO|nr:DUF3500 domain-containing protein [Zobellia uliginosa]SIS98848.1 Protein of unknown function [Zobellia uliginosa]
MTIKQSVVSLLALITFQIGQAQELHVLAETFLLSLTDELRQEAQFKLNDDERFNFNYVPLERKGPTFNDFDAIQKEAALALLKTSLSKEGLRKTSEIMDLEDVLALIEKNQLTMPDGSPMRDALNYHFCIFGNPTAKDFWGWRFEGHHLSLNFVASKGTILSATPTFMGSNPGIVPHGQSKGKQVLQKETEMGFSFVHSLTEPQLAQALFAEKAPYEIITGNQRTVSRPEPDGISFTDLSKTQKNLFLNLLDLYLGNYEAKFSKSLKSKIEEAGINKLSFSWAGSLKPGKGHYYRIYGPTILIEYDNTQNNANHVHTVVRDLTNDFGQDILKQHYRHSH